MQAIWIEIPVTDLTRAKAFYEAVFGHPPTDLAEQDARTITIIEGQPTVSLNRTDGFVPTAEGTLPYFHVDDLDAAITAVSKHGGTILEIKAQRPGAGFFALVTDSEGNALYLHEAQ